MRRKNEKNNSYLLRGGFTRDGISIRAAKDDDRSSVFRKLPDVWAKRKKI